MGSLVVPILALVLDLGMNGHSLPLVPVSLGLSKLFLFVSPQGSTLELFAIRGGLLASGHGLLNRDWLFILTLISEGGLHFLRLSVSVLLSALLQSP